MKNLLLLWISTFVVLVFVAGCSSALEKETTQNFLDGAWFVGLSEAHGGVRQIGNLKISGYTYIYQPIPHSEVPPWMEERFPFINELSGSVKYEPENLPSDYFQSIEDDAILTQLSFNTRDELFLIRVDKAKKLLYFHAQASELQLYEISKTYED